MPLLLIAAGVASAQQRFNDTINVTATRTPTRLGDSASSVVVLSREALSTSAAATVDDALRQVPGFSLFRRSGSRTANPTTQGLSLRGIGASGASRALVLDDGIPLNDPFGGWIYWGRVPRAALDRVEIVRGGASDLYGSSALSGVVQFVRRATSPPTIVIDASSGLQQTSSISFYAAGDSGAWGGSLAGDLFTTAGYVLVDRSQRGTVDGRADSRHGALDATLERRFAGDARAFLRGSKYRESRNNGTPLQTNDTTILQLAGGSDSHPFGGTLLVRAYGSDHDYEQTFSAVAADRTSERLTVDQRVPSRSAGGSAQWSAGALVGGGSAHALLIGVEGREVSGASDELQFWSLGTTAVRADGRQRIGAVFMQDLVALTPKTSLAASLRFDAWRNFDARRDGAALPERDDGSWSPRVAVVHRVTDRLSLTASGNRAFRAPTLNELYRGFRVGNVVTLANQSLGPERLSAFEIGARMETLDRHASLRTTLFWMTTSDAIANVTRSITPSVITRQRQNVGGSRSRGAEIEGELRPGRQWRVSAGYLLADSIVTSGQLEGKRLPQVPRHQATLQGAFSQEPLTVALAARWSGSQFDDDLNQFPLRGYFVADAFGSYRIGSRMSLTLAGENLFDRRIEVSATPVVTLGQPRAWRIGVRYMR